MRFPDPAANPYLAFAAMLMAGLDGIQNKIHPGDPMDKNLYDLPPEELKNVPTVCGLAARGARAASTPTTPSSRKGDVFTDDLIDAYIELKWEEVYDFEHRRTRSSSRCTTRSEQKLGSHGKAAPLEACLGCQR